MILNTRQLMIGIVIGLTIGLIFGFCSNPYSITAGTQDRTFKINKMTGRTWIWHYELGKWVECQTQDNRKIGFIAPADEVISPAH